MAKLTIDIPDDVVQAARAKLAEVHRELEDYLYATVFDLTDDRPGVKLDPETEAMLLEGLRSPAIEVDEAFWERHLQRLKDLQVPRATGS